MNRHGQVLDKRLSGEAVAMVVKRYVWWLGHGIEDFAGHSLRAGLATSAAAAGKSERAIMNQTGHRSLKTVGRYIRQGSVFRENAADGLVCKRACTDHQLTMCSGWRSKLRPFLGNGEKWHHLGGMIPATAEAEENVRNAAWTATPALSSRSRGQRKNGRSEFSWNSMMNR